MNNKKVAIISLYVNESSEVPPLGALYLATSLKKHDIDCLIIHENAEKTNKILKDINEYKPDLVGMSIFTGCNNARYAELGNILKEASYKIVLGNAHPSLLPEQCLNESFVDFVIIGEGEETLVELVNNLDDNVKFNSILGLGFKDQDGRKVINPPRDFINIDDYLIDWSLIDAEKYIQPYFMGRYQRTFTITTSRGCPFNCQFCYNLVFNKRKWRAHSVEKIIENIKPLIEKHKIDAIRFLDDNFFVDKNRAFAIVDALGLPYFAETRVENIDEEFVKRLKETKCQELLFGFESGSERIMREVVQKGSGVENSIKAVRLLNNSGIIATGSMVFGFPSETKEEYWETMRFIVSLLEINKNLAFTSGWFLPFPGTGLYEEAKKRGFVPPKRLAEWDKFNRWRHDYKMEWIDWDYRLPVKYSRQMVNLLAMAYKRDIPFLKKILKWRIEYRNFSWPVDLYIFSRIRDIYLFSGEKSAFNRQVKKAISFVMKHRKKV